MITVVACIKFVCSNLLSNESSTRSVYSINPYDMYMLEQLFSLKKACGCRLIGVTMCPSENMQFAQKLVAMGLDDIYFVTDQCFAGSDTYATSYILSNAMKHVGPAQIYCFGEKSIDGETGQVPIGISSILNMLCHTGVESIHSCNDESVRLKCIHGSLIESIEATYPLSIRFLGFTTRELPVSLIKLKKFRNYEPIILNTEILNLDKRFCGQHGSKTKVLQVKNVVNKREAKVLEGSVSTIVEAMEKIITRGGPYT